MFCVKNGRYGPKLRQLSATNLADDRQLFRVLRDSYHKHRGRWRYTGPQEQSRVFSSLINYTDLFPPSHSLPRTLSHSTELFHTE